VQANKKFLVVCISTLITAGCSNLTFRDIDSLPASASLPAKSQQGQVDIWFYDSVNISSVEELENLARFPDNPDEIVQVSKLEMLDSRGDRYASFVRGYITPPSNGQYRFFLNSDDDSQFFLSSSDSPAAAALVATVPGWASRGDFSKYSSQKSSDFTLLAKNRYYFEIRHREGNGGDRFSVAWKGPGFSQTVIGGQYLSSFAGTSNIYPMDEMSVAGYGLGYRVGFFDANQSLPFDIAYPPLDEDQDGLYDNWEVFYGLNPADASDSNADVDDDLLTNYDEFKLGTAPSNVDSDGDGIPDGAEFAYGLDPLNSNGSLADLDNDGFSNLEEYRFGSDITNSEDIPVSKESRVSGVWAQYFSGRNFERFLVAKVESQLEFDWRKGSPAPEVPSDRFSARYYTQFTPLHEGGVRQYEVIVNGDDGIRVDFDGERIVEKWSYSSAPISAKISVNSGQSYSVRVEYTEDGGNANFSVKFIDFITGKLQDSSRIFTTSSLSGSENRISDQDDDGMPDVWEYKQGTNVYKSDASAVNNVAGITNLEAFQSDLDPWTAEAMTKNDASSSSSAVPQPIPPVIDTNQSSVTLIWTAPSSRVDGNSMALGDIKGYELSYGRQFNALDKKINIQGQETRYTIRDLYSGTWYFHIRTYDYDNIYSEPTEVIDYTIR
jgi:hypothetical protein